MGPELVRWLGGLDEPWGFEIQGSIALVYGPPSSGVEEPLERLHAFVSLAGRPEARTTLLERQVAAEPLTG